MPSRYLEAKDPKCEVSFVETFIYEQLLLLGIYGAYEFKLRVLNSETFVLHYIDLCLVAKFDVSIYSAMYIYVNLFGFLRHYQKVSWFFFFNKF